MINIINYLREKIFFIIGALAVIAIIIILVTFLSKSIKSNNYSAIEQKMVNATEKYYIKHEKQLPKTDSETVKINVSTLIKTKLLKELKDPKDKENPCTGYVEITKVGKEYSYMPFLTCKGNYEPEYLVNKIKATKLDEYGNGLYENDGEFIYKGEDVNNYVSFNNQNWRIIKIDSDGDLKLLSTKRLKSMNPWDDSYNSDRKDNVGINTDYLHSDVRKTLQKYYKTNFNIDAKAKIVTKNLCVGGYTETGEYSYTTECSKIKENETIGLLNATDYKNASYDSKCISLASQECSNYNYLADSETISTWTLNVSSENTFKAILLEGEITFNFASANKRVMPVIYITSKSIVTGGKGTFGDPYIVKNFTSKK